MIGFACKEDLKYDKRYTSHYSEYDPDESVEQQKHQQNHGCLECRIFVDFVHLPQEIITDPHIDRTVVFEGLVNEILLVGIEFLNYFWIGWLLSLQWNILPDSRDIFDFGIEERSSVSFDFFHTRSDRISENIYYTAGCIREILAGKREFRVISENE